MAGVNIGDYIDGTEISWADMSYSDTAAKNCIMNEPKEDRILEEIKKTAQMILQPCLERFNGIYISSGYRGPELNAAVGGAGQSQHCKGQAADFWIPGKKNMFGLYKYIYENLNFDKLIVEKPPSGWCHCSQGDGRRQLLVYDPTKGLKYEPKDLNWIKNTYY